MDLITLMIYILFFIPGFIYIKIKDYLLSKEKKEQFTMTLEIVLMSAFIWIISLVFVNFFFNTMFKQIITVIIDALNNNSPNKIITNLILINKKFFVTYFLINSIFGFCFAILWVKIRKLKIIRNLIIGLTGRNEYYYTIIKFFEDNVEKAIDITTEDKRYIGILKIAPDNYDDKYIILRDVYFVENNIPQKNEAIENIAIKYDEIKSFLSYKDEYILK